MNKYHFEVKPNETINQMRLTNIEKKEFNIEPVKFDHPINLEESYIQVLYPQRKEYIKNLQPLAYEKHEYPIFHTPFESDKIDFSTALPRSFELKYFGEVYIEVDRDCEVLFLLSTCGVVDIFINEKHACYYAPMTRNLISKKEITLPLKKGLNKLNVACRDLAERDIIFNFELRNKSLDTLRCFVPIVDNEANLKNTIAFAESIYFEKDEYESGEMIKIYYNKELIKENISATLSDIKPIIKADKYFAAINKQIEFDAKSDYIVINSDELPIGTYRIGVNIPSEEGDITRKILITNYVFSPDNIFEYEDRKRYLSDNLLKYSPNNITKSLLLASKEKTDNEFNECFENGITFINTHGDCADFQTVPLLWLLMKYPEALTDDQYRTAKETLFNFRFWLDEPGNDAMWWFSENHAFLFHITQYLAGYNFPTDVFNVGGLCGQENYEIGKERLIKWFKTFKKYQFGEWNSTTYFPVDFIGFIALYECAPDLEIQKLAKEALDLTFDIIQRNIHHNLMACTYGRVYENELKGLRNGELSLITWLFFNKGYYNTTNRASIMLSLSDYSPKIIENYDTEKTKEFEMFYVQGFNNVGCYIYKNIDFAISAAINYKYMRKGHQQHLMNISFSKDEIQMWLNNPGEKVFSGDGRPSYWAGNSINPQIFAKENMMLYNYDNTHAEISFTHMYFPTYKFEEYKVNNNIAYAQNKGAYIGIVSTSEINLSTLGSVANRELIFNDLVGSIFIYLGSKEEYKSIDEFERYLHEINIEIFNTSTHVETPDNKYLVTNDQFYINNNIVEYS